MNPGFLDLIEPCARLAIVGTAKNVGKTTTLNWLLDRLDGVIAGITSVGRDGEAVDGVTNKPKPRINPPVGTLVATSRATLSRATAKLSRVRETFFRTALGPVDIYRVESPGIVEVAGPVAAYQALAVAEELERQGAGKILIDGAIDRRASAAIVDGVVLATGMNLDPDPAEVFRLTQAHCRMLNISRPPLLLPEGTGVLCGEAWTPWQGSNLERENLLIPEEADFLSLDGAFTEGLALRLLKKRPLSVVVNSGAHLVAGPEVFERMLRNGFHFFARKPIKLLAVTLNPTRPDDSKNQKDRAESFLETMHALPAPVFDLCRPS